MREDSFAAGYLQEVADLALALPADRIEQMVAAIVEVRARGGRLFLLGVGGGAAHASHAACDFRKICHLEAYAPTDNVAELTARTNDEGWESAFAGWLQISRLNERDGVLVFSVGGGSREWGLSTNLVGALELARRVGAAVLGIVGRSDGATAQLADVCVVVPAPPERLTPHVEAFQAVIWHLLVSHPALAAQPAAWESLAVDRAAP
jgi:D-sedoheptulose 7-phosphate isomerase